MKNRATNRVLYLALALGAVALVALVVMLAAGTQPPARAAGDTIKVPDDYGTIQAAIDAATDGDTILVAKGTYTENLSITEGITLSGGWDSTFTVQSPRQSTIDGGFSGRVISITCASSDTVVTIDGFTIGRGDASGLGVPEVSELAGSTELPYLFQNAAAAQLPDPRSPAEQLARLQTRLAGAVERGLLPGGPAAYKATLDRVEAQIALLEGSQAGPRSTNGPSQAGMDCGGGIYSWNASLHLVNSWILLNAASRTGDACGGGVYVGQAAPSGTVVIGNVLEDNLASTTSGAFGMGGGLYVYQAPGVHVEYNEFYQNAASSAGVESIGVGGALALEASPAAVVSGNKLARNTANAGWEAQGGLGGGLALHEADGTTVADNEFHQNLANVHGSCGGGGLFAQQSDDVLVTGNEVVGNWACIFQRGGGAGGGGMALVDNDTITVTGNLMEANTTALSVPSFDLGDSTTGGGLDGLKLSAARIADNTFSGNVAGMAGVEGHVGHGGGASLWDVYQVEVADNTFAGNVGVVSDGQGVGGGLQLKNSEYITVRHNRFEDNLAGPEEESRGGGLNTWEDGLLNYGFTVDANLFLDNRASPNGNPLSHGGACDIEVTEGFRFTSNVLAGNAATKGGGLWASVGSQGEVTNNTLAGNGGTGIFLSWVDSPMTLTNNIMVSHTVGISVTEGATATVRYTLWHGNNTDIAGAGVISHTHPVSGTPGFVDPAADDYHLTMGSAAINAGVPEGVPPAPDHDADGVTRPQGPGVDLGAYEWQGHWRYLPFAAKDWKPAIGWAVGNSADGYGTILRTTDSGQNWFRQGQPGEVPDADLESVSAVDAANAWVVGVGVILRTRDGGQTWEQQSLPAGVPTDTALYGVKAIDGNIAWAVGHPDALLGTTDGHTWSVLPRNADLHLSSPVQYSDVDAANATHVWAVGGFDPHGSGQRGEGVIAFYDGVEWHRQGAGVIPYDEMKGSSLIGVSVLDQDTVWAVGRFAMKLVKTTDGGASWQQVGPELSPGDTNQVVAVTADSGWATGDYGSIQRTDDGGQSWSPQSPGGGAWTYGVTALDLQRAWSVGPSQTGKEGWLMRTRDGQHWEIRPAPVEAGLSGVSFVGARR